MSDCTQGCSLPERREFLKAVTLAVGAVMVGLATPREVAALPLSLGHPLIRAGDQITYPIPSADGAVIDKENEVILVRWKGMAYAFNLSCPHQNTALRWYQDDSRFQCPKHKSKYQPDGTFISGRATRNMDRFGIRKAGNNLIVDVAAYYKSDKQAAQWGAAKVAL
ncbi:MAG TPA: Rieske 2Fe-2S domain-containing protein [Gemmatimonadales bacterium]|nr:Rieske 2Fe-2S domain-containing protein [Gemmatimonadales bacterium]